MTGELVPMAEVAEMLSVAKRSVARWAAEGKLPRPIRPTGGKCYFRREDIERLLRPRGGEDARDA